METSSTRSGEEHNTDMSASVRVAIIIDMARHAAQASSHKERGAQHCYGCQRCRLEPQANEHEPQHDEPASGRNSYATTAASHCRHHGQAHRHPGAWQDSQCTAH